MFQRNMLIISSRTGCLASRQHAAENLCFRPTAEYEYGTRKRDLGLENRTGLVAVALLAITVVLLIITRIATSYDVNRPMPPIERIETNKIEEPSQHDIDVMLGKAPPSSPPPFLKEPPSSPGLSEPSIPGLSEHDIDVILGKVPPPPPPSPEPLRYDTSVLGTTKVKKIAVILETRPLTHLLPLILQFSSVLGSEWPIHLFLPPSIIKALYKSSAFSRSVEEGRIKPGSFPIGTPIDYAFHDPIKRAEFLTRPWFWESLMPAEHVLMFDADSMICSKSWLSIDDFLQYDFIGAPLAPLDPTHNEIVGVSGTLSLRNREAMLNVARGANWEKEASQNRDAKGVLRKTLEDEWFWGKMVAEPIHVKGKKWATLPNLEAARLFAMGDVWKDEPFGYDGALSKFDDRKGEALSWCPEYGISPLANAEDGKI